MWCSLALMHDDLQVRAHKPTSGTFRGVDARFQPSVARQQSQYCAYGTKGVAIGASVAPSQYGDNDAGEKRHQKCWQAFQPHLCGVEGITVYAFGHVGQCIVSQGVKRGEKILYHASVGAVRCQQHYKRGDAGYESYDENDQHSVSKQERAGE